MPVPPLRPTSTALLAATIGAQVLFPRVPTTRRDAATKGIVALLCAQALASLTGRRGTRRGLTLAAVTAVAGTAAEAVGVRTGRPFGQYAYTGKLGPDVAGVPIAVPAAWTMMAPAAWAVAGRVAPGRRERAVLAAAALTAWDVALDPRMAREGFWVWGSPGRYEGIPASNFAGWFAVGLVIFGTWAVLDDEPPDDLDLALYVWTWVGEVVANLVYWERPRVALAAGTAMGVVAAPALRARWRTRSPSAVRLPSKGGSVGPGLTNPPFDGVRGEQDR